MEKSQEANSREGVELIALRLYEFVEWIELLSFDATGQEFVSAVNEEISFLRARLGDVDPVVWVDFIDLYRAQVHGEEPVSPRRRVECAPVGARTSIPAHPGGNHCGWSA